MKLQRSTVGLVITALLLGSGVLISQVSRQSGSPTATPGEAAAPVYDFAETSVVELQIENDFQAVAFTKDGAGFWQMTEPEAMPAEEAAIAFLLSRLTTDGLLQTTTIDAAEQADFGLDSPSTTVDIILADGTTHQLLLGDPDFSGTNVYALIDPEIFPLPEDAGEVTVAIVSEDIVNGTNRPLDEWQAVVEEPDPVPEEEEESDGEDEEPSPANEDETEAAEGDAADGDDGESSEDANPEAENTEATEASDVEDDTPTEAESPSDTGTDTEAE
ncbi:MAG: DUF4340 domain-containing protein [Cyanobacteria bacterium J06638_28]